LGYGFNPRARVERDLKALSEFYNNACFNPRARVERDFFYTSKYQYGKSFNPRARVERDQKLLLP